MSSITVARTMAGILVAAALGAAAAKLYVTAGALLASAAVAYKLLAQVERPSDMWTPGLKVLMYALAVSAGMAPLDYAIRDRSPAMLAVGATTATVGVVFLMAAGSLAKNP